MEIRKEPSFEGLLSNDSLPGGLPWTKEMMDTFARCFPDSVLLTHIAGETIEHPYVSQSLLDMLGYTREEYNEQLGGQYLLVLHPEDAAAVHTPRANESDEVASLRYRVFHRDGSLRWLEEHYRRLPSQDGEYRFSLVRDVTEEVIAAGRREREQAEYYDGLRRMIRDDYLVLIDFHLAQNCGVVIHAASEFGPSIGKKLSAEELFSFASSTVTTPDGQPLPYNLSQFTTLLHRIGVSHGVYSKPFRIHLRGGCVHWMQCNAWHVGEGERCRVYIALKNTDSTNLLSRKVEKSQDDLNKVSSALDALISVFSKIYIFNLTDGIGVDLRSSANAQALNILDVAREDLSRVHPSDRERFRHFSDLAILRAMAVGQSVHFSFRYRDSSSEKYRWGSAQFTRIASSEPKVLIAVEDLSGKLLRRNVNWALLTEQQQHLNESFGIISKFFTAAYQCDLDKSLWSCLHGDATFSAELSGCEPGSPLFWERFLRRIYPDDRERVCQELKRSSFSSGLRGDSWMRSAAFRLVRSDGVLCWLNISLIYICDEISHQRNLFLLVRTVDRDYYQELLSKTEESLDLERRRNQAFSKIYSTIVLVNLSQDRYEIANAPASLSEFIRPSDTYGEFVKFNLMSLHPAFIEKYDRTFSREALEERYRRGEGEVYMEYLQRIDPDSYAWGFTHIIFIENPYNEDIQFVLLSNLVDEKVRALQSNNAYLLGLDAAYDHLLLFDLVASTYEVIKSTVDVPGVLLSHTDAQTRIKAKQLLPEFEVERFTSLFSPRGMHELIREAGDSYCAEFQVRVPGSEHLRWMRITLSGYRDMDSGNLKCIMGMQDVDREKAAELARNEVTQRFLMLTGRAFDTFVEFNPETDELNRFHIEDNAMVSEAVSVGWSAGRRYCAENLVHPEHRAMFLEKTSPEALQHLSRGDDAALTSLTFLSRISGDEYKWVTLWIHAYRSAETMRFFSYVQDVDVEQREREAHMQELIAARREAEIANRTKSDFLANMSHDIRTPLNAVIGMTELAQDDLSNAERVADCLQKINLSSHHLLSLVNDILDMSMIERGKLRLSLIDTDLSAIMDEITDILEPQARRRNLVLKIERSEAHCIAKCDPLRVKQIGINIISNAIKFTPPGGSVSVSTHIRPITGNRIELQLVCTDTGIGMSPEFVSRLFSPFEREENQLVALTEGTGLGMVITKRILEQMGGNITVESAQGKGTTMVVTLPLECCAVSAEAADEPVVRHELSLFGRHILIAEDVPMNMEIIKILTERTGAAVDCAENGAMAVELFRYSTEGYYSLVLMDIQMPEMDGYSAARTIRAMERSDSDVPIIAMTAFAFAEDVEKAMQSGMSAHITKPIDRNEFYAVLGKHIR